MSLSCPIFSIYPGVPEYSFLLPWLHLSKFRNR